MTGDLMRRHLLKILYLGSFAAMLLAVAVLAARGPGAAAVLGLSVALVLVAAGATLFVGARVGGFRRGLERFVRHLLAGQYEVGFRRTGEHCDEVAQMESLLERLGEQLRAYDALRAERVRYCRRSLDALFDHVGQSVMLLDVEKGKIEVNPAMRGLLGAGPQGLTFATLTNMEANRGFSDVLRAVVEDDKMPRQARVRVQCRPQESPVEMEMQFVPVKDKDEKVELVIVLGPVCAA